MAKLKGLGRGLDALLGGEDNAAPPQGDLRMMNVSHLAPGKYQPRTLMDSESLQELADSIRAQGLMQPILVREVAGGFEIIAGERRWRAAQLAGLSEIPVLVREVADEAVAAMALIENIQREDLNAIDEAHGLQRLIHEFGMTHDAVAKAVGKSRAAVSNLLRLLNLSHPVQNMLTAGLIEMGHARALLPLQAGAQRELAHEIETKGLSVREVERRVARLKDTPAAP
ncbi:MAG: ParB family transcriptional regulator, chromosome partitioning protein, partial [Pseudomonadota bacterium]|nr:ParB family transcriptional regulator, chromosome partitioning protein [Pseudomonadota bacterium]